MKKIPKFKSLDEAAAFWDSHDFEDYVGDTKPVKITVRIPPRQKFLTIPVDLKVYERLEALAAKRGMRVEKLAAAWLQEKALAHSDRC